MGFLRGAPGKGAAAGVRPSGRSGKLDPRIADAAQYREGRRGPRIPFTRPEQALDARRGLRAPVAIGFAPGFPAPARRSDLLAVESRKLRREGSPAIVGGASVGAKPCSDPSQVENAKIRSTST